MTMSESLLTVNPVDYVYEKEEYENCKSDLNIYSTVLEEIALEGLDGITMQALFERLKVRPGFPFKLEEKTKEFIWQICQQLNGVEIYMLEQNRPQLVIYDRRDYLDSKGNIYEPKSAPEEIYTYYPIEDKVKNNRGSCLSYSTRSLCPASHITYEELSNLYLNQVVIVANQSIREKLLQSPESDFQFSTLSLTQYCILERVGRARYHGEITKGKCSLGCMGIEAKTLFYQRQDLIKYDVLKKQNFSMKFEAQINTGSIGVTILHLPRFYVEYVSILRKNVVNLISSIKSSNVQAVASTVVRNKFGRHAVANFLQKEFRNIFIQKDMKLCDLRPEEYANTLNPIKRNTLEKTSLRVFCLKDKNINIENYKELVEDEEKEEESLANVGRIPLDNLTRESSCFYRMWSYILSKRGEGASFLELSECTSSTQLDARTCVRHFMRHKMVTTKLEDKKKTKVTRYIFTKFKPLSSASKDSEKCGDSKINICEDNEEEITFDIPDVTEYFLTHPPQSPPSFESDESFTEIIEEIEEENTHYPEPSSNENEEKGKKIVIKLEPLSPTKQRKSIEKLVLHSEEVDSDSSNSFKKSKKFEDRSSSKLDQVLPPDFEPPTDLNLSQEETQIVNEAEPLSKSNKSRINESSPPASPPPISMPPPPCKLNKYLDSSLLSNKMSEKYCYVPTSIEGGDDEEGDDEDEIEEYYDLYSDDEEIEESNFINFGLSNVSPSVRKLNSPNRAGRPTKRFLLNRKLNPGAIRCKSGRSYKLQESHALSEIVFSEEVRKLLEASESGPLVENLPPGYSLDEMKFIRGEQDEFIALGHNLAGRILAYVTPNEWRVELQDATLSRSDRKLPVAVSTRNCERANLVIKLIYSNVVTFGFQLLMRKMREEEARVVDNDDPVVLDRRTLYRILHRLHRLNLIQILRLSISKGTIVRTCSVFTPANLPIESRVMMKAVSLLTKVVQGRVKLSPEERNKILHNQHQLLISEKKKMKKRMKRRRRQIKAGTPIVSGQKIYRKPIHSCKNYDKQDLEALKLMTKKRTHWLPEEDREILCLYSASVLFIPKYNHAKVFLFNAHQIRDCLHELLPSSCNKTSIAIRRRIHTILKMPHFVKTYRFVISQALNDPDLKEKYIKPYIEKKYAHRIFQTFPKDALLDLRSYLVRKFKIFDLFTLPHERISKKPPIEALAPLLRGIGSFLTLEGDEEEEEEGLIDLSTSLLYEWRGSNYIVNPVNEVFCRSSLSCWVTRSFILSVGIGGDDFEAVEKFLEGIRLNILNYSLNCAKTLGIIMWQRSHSRYGGSTMLKNKIVGTGSASVVSESYKWLKELQKFDSEEFKKVEVEDVGSSILFNSLAFEEIFDIEIVVSEPLVTICPEWQLAFEKIMDAYITKDTLSEPSSEDEEHSNSTDGRVGKGQKRARTKSISRHKNKRIRTDKSKSDKSNDVTLVDISLSDDEEAAAAKKIRRGQMISDRAIRVIRSQLNNQTDSDSLVTRDFFNVNLCDVNIRLDPSLLDAKLHSISLSNSHAALNVLTSFLCQVVDYPQVRLSGQKNVFIKLPRPSDLGKFSILYDVINCTMEKGMSIHLLKSKFTGETLSVGLKYLVSTSKVFVVGVSMRKFVTIEYIEPWTILVPPKKQPGSYTRILMRPWITLEGFLNWALLDHCFSSILDFTQKNPDSRIEKLSAKFLPVLSNVEVILLLKAMDLFSFFTYSKIESIGSGATLFSRPTFSHITKNCNIDPFLEIDSCCINLKPLAVIKYAQLQELMRDRLIEEDSKAF